MIQTYFLPDVHATRALATSIGGQLVAGDLVLLSGELGAGKTTFAQELARSLGVTEDVTSPTFVLMLEYQSGRVPLLHCDAYRLENLEHEELEDAGLFDFLTRRDSVRLLEWPERVASYLPSPTWKIDIAFENNGRRATIWRAELP